MNAPASTARSSSASRHRMLGALNGAATRAHDVDRPPHGAVRRHEPDAAGDEPPRSRARPGLDERYVREWLGAMVTGGLVEYATDRRRPTRCRASTRPLLTRAARPDNVAATLSVDSACSGSVEDRILECFERGGGVPYSAFARFHAVMAEESDQTPWSRRWSNSIVPLVPGLPRRARARHRRARRRLRQRPRAEPTGGRVPAQPLRRLRHLRRGGRGRAQPRRASCGLANVRFARARRRRARPRRTTSTCVTAFYSIHDQARPDLVLRGIADASAAGRRVPACRTSAATSHLHEDAVATRSRRSSTRSRVCTA